ncbi:hypothetical protein B4U80_13502 [Leptotrombidium deliense]|uniref:Cystatin domain-containing protein n=1 Tax=Leptotrombidium deliense TaxID=299467 RepID=A0A443S5D3_9ACAR|nr:hypothetical protein B4U80_13502 [Leptotrombidium deliense]
MKYILCIALLLAAVALSLQNPGLIGGWNPIQNENKKNELVKFSVVYANEVSDAYYVKNVVRVLDAQQQLVSGVNYKLTFELGTTDCKREGADLNNIDHCVPKDNGNVEVCEIVIWEKVWLNQRDVTRFNCEKQ